MIHKIKFILLAIFGLLSMEDMHAQWIIEKCPSSNNLNSIHLFNEQSGWIVGDKGTMLYKVNNYWTNYQKITNENLYSVFMLDKDNGWAVGSKGAILHFDGDKWKSVPSPTREDLYSVSFKDRDNGIAVGRSGTVVIYENGTWELYKKVTRGNLYAVSTNKDETIIGGGLECVNIPLMKMIDNAEKTIINSFNPYFTEIKSISQTEQKNVWAVGSPAEIFHYNGSEWNRLEFDNKLPSLNCVFFSDENNGISVGYCGTILTYGEGSWTRQNSPVEVKLSGAAISGRTYYAIGDNGTILTSKLVYENAPSFISNHNTPIKIETYPNPSNDMLNIIIPNDKDFVSDQISISNGYGQVVLNKRVDPGNGSQVYQLNTSELKNGLYLVTILSSGKKEAIGKFLVKH